MAWRSVTSNSINDILEGAYYYIKWKEWPVLANGTYNGRAEWLATSNGGWQRESNFLRESSHQAKLDMWYVRYYALGDL